MPWKESALEATASVRAELSLRDASNLVLFAGFKVADTVENNSKEVFTNIDITEDGVEIAPVPEKNENEKNSSKKEGEGKGACAPPKGRKTDNAKAKVISHAAFADGYIKLEKNHKQVGDSARPSAVRASHGAE